MSDPRFRITCADKRVRTEIMPVSGPQDGVALYRVRVTLPEKMTPPAVRIAWEEPMVGILNVWTPVERFERSLEKEANFSRFHYGAPMLSAIGEGDVNHATVALSDAEDPLEIGFRLKDLSRTDTVEYTVTLFAQRMYAICSYETLIRIDTRPIPFYQAIGEVYGFWKTAGYEIPQPPAEAEDPLYSTWYSCWQNPRADRLLPDLKAAAELGFRTVILDDGWQFSGEEGDGYAKCGEWQPSPEKFPDFGAFVRGVHELGMKLIVWFAVPFVGKESPLFERFWDRLLEIVGEPLETGILDIRYPEVREFLIGHYRRFLTDYGIDGFKFDFIGSFGDEPESIPYDPAVMDCETVSSAVRTLLREIDTELGAIRPGLLYEYRQGYIGPAINGFGGMLRVGDCPYDPVRNRVGIVDLRLLGYPVAVHSDMLVWRPEESVRLCARQLLNILFGVPQISIRLLEAPAEQRALLRAYIGYWTQNRGILLHGRFCPQQPENNYPVIRAVGADKEIAVLYGVQSYDLGELPCDVFLNGEQPGLFIRNTTDRARRAAILGGFGTELFGEAEIPPQGVVRLEVPPTGMARIG